MEKSLNWAVLGCGSISNEMAAVLERAGKHFCAVGNRSREKAVSFAENYHIPKVYDDFHEIFHDPEVDVIYISTPHNTHFEFICEAVTNGKHVLCEKAATLNTRELEEAAALARQNHVVFAEAMTIWHMPLYKKIWKLLTSGEEGGIPALGKVQMIQSNFGSFREYDMNDRFFNMELAGGALLDIGVYAISLVRSFMASQPDQILSQVKFVETGADEQSGILLMNAEGQMATVALSLHSKQPKRAVISCENAYIEIMEYPRAQKAVIVEAVSGKRHEIAAGSTEEALYYEVMDMEDAILTGNTDIMMFPYTKDVMEIMTKLRKEWNMKYPGEEW